MTRRRAPAATPADAPVPSPPTPESAPPAIGPDTIIGVRLPLAVLSLLRAALDEFPLSARVRAGITAAYDAAVSQGINEVSPPAGS